MERLLLVVVLVGLLPGPVVAAAGPAVSTDDPLVDVRDVVVEVSIERVNATALAYHLSFSFPSGARAGRVLPYSGQVTRADGFWLARDARSLVWNGTPNASLTVVSDVRRAAAAGCTCVATDDWVLADPVRVQVSVRRGSEWVSAYLTDWLSDSTVAADVTVEDGLFLPGAVVLGDVSVSETTTAAGERVRLVRPAVAADSPDEEAVLDAMTRASARFDVGRPPTDTVTAVVVPDVGESDAHVDGMDDRGRAVGHGYVYLDEDTDATTWTHEYVHTRQTFTTASDMRWFVEATAEYYGYYLAAERESDARRLVAERFGGVEPRSNRVLAVPETWGSRSVPYRQGGRVVAHLDRRVREETSGNRTFLDVFRRLNGRENVGVSDLQDATAAVVGSRTLDDEIDRYVRTGATVAQDGGLVPVEEPDRRIANDVDAGLVQLLDSPLAGPSAATVHRRVIDVATGASGPSVASPSAVAALVALLVAVLLWR